MADANMLEAYVGSDASFPGTLYQVDASTGFESEATSFLVTDTLTCEAGYGDAREPAFTLTAAWNSTPHTPPSQSGASERRNPRCLACDLPPEQVDCSGVPVPSRRDAPPPGVVAAPVAPKPAPAPRLGGRHRRL